MKTQWRMSIGGELCAHRPTERGTCPHSRTSCIPALASLKTPGVTPTVGGPLWRGGGFVPRIGVLNNFKFIAFAPAGVVRVGPQVGGWAGPTHSSPSLPSGDPPSKASLLLPYNADDRERGRRGGGERGRLVWCRCPGPQEPPRKMKRKNRRELRIHICMCNGFELYIYARRFRKKNIIE